MINTILKKYGTAMMLCRGTESWEVRAFFQPVRSKSWETSDSDYSPLGEIPRGRYVYIGPLEPEAAAGDTVRLEDKAYLMRRSEIIRDGSGPVYCWGLCLEKGGADHWGRQS